MCYVYLCVSLPSSSSFSPSTAGAVGYNVQERPGCQKALVQILVHPPNGNGSLKQGRLKREESLRMITGCAVTRRILEDHVRREQGI